MPITLLLAAGLSASACAAPSIANEARVRAVVGHRPARNERLLTGLEEIEGDVPQTRVFVRRGSGWVEHTLGDSQEIVASFVTPARRRILLGFHVAGGPGEEFFGLVLSPMGTALACPKIGFPSDLNRDERTGERDWQMEMLELDGLSVDARGRGMLRASGTINDRGVSRQVRYEYRTTDGGLTWSSPHRLAVRPSQRR